MKPLLHISNLHKYFPDSPSGLKNVSLTVKRGEVVALVGPSGSGKSTLMRCIAGLEELQSGSISLREGGDSSAYSPEQLRNRTTYVFQDYNLWPHKTVLENITLAPVQRGLMRREEALAHASSLLEKFGLADKSASYPDFLSGGQKQRVAVIRALMLRPDILLLDEITSALDPELVSSVLNLIAVLAKEGQTMLLATHNLKFAMEVADTIVFLEGGAVTQVNNARDFVYAQTDPRISDFLREISVSKQEIKVYEGFDQFQAFQLGTLRRFKRGSSKCVVGSSGDRWFECMGNYYEQYERERLIKGISWKMLLYNESPLDKDLRQRYPELNVYRLLPKDFENPANYYVIEDTVVIQIFGKPGDAPSIIEIRNPAVAKSYQNHFDILWAQSSPLGA